LTSETRIKESKKVSKNGENGRFKLFKHTDENKKGRSKRTTQKQRGYKSSKIFMKKIVAETDLRKKSEKCKS
jgi:hypothetical protein